MTVRWLPSESHGLPRHAGDISTGQDALALEQYGDADAIITNSPTIARSCTFDRTLHAHLAGLASARNGLGLHAERA